MTGKILIKYHGKTIPAIVIDDYKVTISQEEAGVAGKLADEYEPVELEQCRNCGTWCSEDDELYEDGYCDRCAAICEECQLYFYYENMIKVSDGYICKKCHVKE